MTTRADVRDALAGIFEDGTTGAANGNLVQAVYPNVVSDLEGQSPVIVLMSQGTQRTPMGIVSVSGDSFTQVTYKIGVRVFVMDANADAGWSDADVENRLDAIDGKLGELVGDNRDHTLWQDLRFEDSPSTIMPFVSEGGVDYVVEASTLLVTLY